MSLTVNINQIAVDPAFQCRIGGLDDAHVKFLEEIAPDFPPLTVIKQGNHYLLLDGAHRLASCENRGLTSVEVEVVDVSPDKDLLEVAFDLNAKHGRPLNLSDRRHFAAHLLQQHPEWADREVGRRCGLSQPTVANVRADLEQAAKIERVTTRQGSDGKLYPATPTNTKRREGELPGQGALEMAGDALAGIFSSADRVRQRKIAQFYRRLTVALGDIDNLPDDGTPEKDAKACRLVLGNEKALELGNELGRTSSYVLSVAEALGYKE